MQKGQEQADDIALQGTGRMALYAGLHPAQLKDSVTSASCPSLPFSHPHTRLYADRACELT